MASALVATALIAVPVTARAGGLFDLFFSGFQQRPANVNSYAEPPAPIGRVAPVSPGGSESVNQGSDTGHGVAFCVRLCDGQHFPLERASNSTPVETCRAMCPASKTKVFFGSEIGASRAGDGQRYTDIDNAFIYRKQLVANCTCNGRDAFGLAPYEMNSDPTLRPGDIVTTKDGFVAYAGKTECGRSFTPLDTATVSGATCPHCGSGAGVATRHACGRSCARAHAGIRRRRSGLVYAVADGAARGHTRSILEIADDQFGDRQRRCQSGDSMPNRFTSRGMPWSFGPAIMKSAWPSPLPVSFGRMPQ